MRVRIFLASVICVLGSLVPIVGGQVINAPPAAAITGNCGAITINTHYFDGVDYSYPYLIVGSAAYIVTRPATVCTGGSFGQSSSAWDMTAASQTQDYIQSGFQNIYGYPYRTFSEMNDNGNGGTNICGAGCSHTFGTQTNDGDNILYWQYYSPPGSTCPNGCMTSWAGLQLLNITPYNPYLPGQWAEPISAQFYGEVNAAASDIPGNSHDGYTTFSSMEYLGLDDLYHTSWPIGAFDGTTDTRASHDAPVNHNAPNYTVMDIYCTVSCTP